MAEKKINNLKKTVYETVHIPPIYMCLIIKPKVKSDEEKILLVPRYI